MIDIKLIIINMIFSSCFMILFSYIFYFHFIIYIENKKILEIIDIKLIPEQFIESGITSNKGLEKLAKKLVISYSILSFFLGLFLVFLFKKNLFEVLRYNLYLIIITICIEIIFIYSFLPNVGMFDTNDIYNTINNSIITIYYSYYNYLNC